MISVLTFRKSTRYDKTSKNRTRFYYVSVTKRGKWSQQLRLIVPHVFNMANGTDLFENWKLARLNATLTSIPYRRQAITALFYPGPRGPFSGNR